MTPLIKPDAVLFDWDNTLVDTWIIIHEALAVTFEAFGMEPWSLKTVQARVARSMRESFPDLFGEEWEEAADVFYAHFEKIHLANLTPLEGAVETLSQLKDAGYYLALVSNKRGNILRIEVEHLGWSDYFGKVIGAGDAARDKPAPDPIIMALSQSGIPAGPQTWYAGDSGLDLMAAHSAGCVPVLVRQKPPEDGEFPDSEPAFHAADCKALFKVLASL